MTTMKKELSLLRRMTSELDRVFADPFGFAAWPALPEPPASRWMPEVDLFERDGRLITKVDLPGMKKEDVSVEVSDGMLVIAGERRGETEKKTDRVYRAEREYGSFYRAVPLPEGVTLDDITATFTDGVLEVGVPLPARTAPKGRTIEVTDGARASKPAA